MGAAERVHWGLAQSVKKYQIPEIYRTERGLNAIHSFTHCPGSSKAGTLPPKSPSSTPAGLCQEFHRLRVSLLSQMRRWRLRGVTWLPKATPLGGGRAWIRTPSLFLSCSQVWGAPTVIAGSPTLSPVPFSHLLFSKANAPCPSLTVRGPGVGSSRGVASNFAMQP